MQALGSAIIRKREERGWKSYRLARNASVDPGYLRDIEQGKGKRPGADVLARIAHALGLTTEALFATAGLGSSVHPVPSEIDIMYQRLDTVQRRAWLRMGHTLQEMKAEYEALQRNGEDSERRIAEEQERYGEKEELSPEEELGVLPYEDQAAHQETPEERAERLRKQREEEGLDDESGGGSEPGA